MNGPTESCPCSPKQKTAEVDENVAKLLKSAIQEVRDQSQPLGGTSTPQVANPEKPFTRSRARAAAPARSQAKPKQERKASKKMEDGALVAAAEILRSLDQACSITAAPPSTIKEGGSGRKKQQQLQHLGKRSKPDEACAQDEDGRTDPLPGRLRKKRRCNVVQTQVCDHFWQLGVGIGRLNLMHLKDCSVELEVWSDITCISRATHVQLLGGAVRLKMGGRPAFNYPSSNCLVSVVGTNH